MDPAARKSLSQTNEGDSVSNRYTQTTTHRPGTDFYPVSSSMRTMDSKRKGLRVSFAFFQESYLPDGRVEETAAWLEEMSDLWKPGTMDGVPTFLMKYSCV